MSSIKVVIFVLTYKWVQYLITLYQQCCALLILILLVLTVVCEARPRLFLVTRVRRDAPYLPPTSSLAYLNDGQPPAVGQQPVYPTYYTWPGLLGQAAGYY